MDRTQVLKAFAATVQASLHDLQILDDILRREQSALTGRDPNALQAVVREKEAVLKQLTPSIQARDRLQKSLGFAAGLDAGDQLVATIDDPVLKKHWQQLVELGRSIAELNDRNGQLAMQGQRAARTALGILTGRSTADDTYSSLRRKKAYGAAALNASLGKV